MAETAVSATTGPSTDTDAEADAIEMVPVVVEPLAPPAALAPPEPQGLVQNNVSADVPFSVLSTTQRRVTALLASFSGFISPTSGSIYYPALIPLADDLKVSVSDINLSITVYMIFQGLAPTFIGSFSDRYGRRPAYLICFVLSVAANVGLALQTDYVALMILRGVQSSGSSGTIALASATAADVYTRAERGKAMMWAGMGILLGPALGPIIGGLLAQFLGWRAIFWFLAIFAGTMLVIMFCFCRETCRSVVGNGSVPPPKWSYSVLQMLRKDLRPDPALADRSTIVKRKKRPSPVDALRILLQKESGIILLFAAIIYACYFLLLASLPSQLQAKYGYNSLQVGLCYLPYGAGSLASRYTVAPLLDRNFRRHAKRLGIEIVRNRQPALTHFPIELARLQISLPLLYAGAVFIVLYGWVMESRTNVAGPLIMLFCIANVVSGGFSAMTTLVVDINQASPATATAASNLSRCLLGAGAVAAAVPVIDRIGMGWTGTVVALIWVVFSPMLWIVIKYGPTWRREEAERRAAKDAAEKQPDVEGAVPSAVLTDGDSKHEPLGTAPREA